MISPKPIFTIHAELAGIVNLGRTPYSERRVIDILGGSVRGAKLNGRILPGGADWQLVRSDGAADIQARTPSRLTPARACWCPATVCGMVRRR